MLCSLADQRALLAHAVTNSPTACSSKRSLLPLQAFPVCHEHSNLARLPVGSLPTYGTAYPVAMVSPLKVLWTLLKSFASASTESWDLPRLPSYSRPFS